MNTNIKSEKIGLTEKVINFFKSSDNQKKFSKDINTIVRLHSENPEKIERLLDVLRRYPIDPTGMSTKELNEKLIEMQRAEKAKDSWSYDPSDDLH